MEEVVHDPSVQAASNATIAIVASAITAVGMALLYVLGKALGIYFQWRKGRLEVQGLADIADLKRQQGTTDFQIERWKFFADKETARADAAEKKAADERKVCDEKMLDIVQRYRSREDLLTKQHQEREHMFNEMAAAMRADSDAKITAVAIQHRECVEESAELRGRMMEMEKREAEREKDIEELKARLGRLDMREVSGRKPRSKPEIDLGKQ